MIATLRNSGVRAALVSALLFGASAPASKLLLDSIDPLLLAGLLYLGSGLGLGLYRLIRRSPRVVPARSDLAPLGGAILAGGIVGPVLLLLGLSAMPASGASLLLNAEAVATAVLAWTVFRENVDRRIALGLVCIVAGAVVITVPDGVAWGEIWPSLAVLGACLAWGLDNNLTRTVALTDASWLAAVKGLVAGPVNLTLGIVAGAALPTVGAIAGALLVGLLSYGISLVLFIVALREVGTARAGAYYSVAPFLGAVLVLLLGEPLTWPLLVAAVLMGIGVWLHLTERHSHEHHHPAQHHAHHHVHTDGHHDHEHPPGTVVGRRGHSHPHEHRELVHTHPHFPDSHHRHRH
ncbi:EamA family transporter [Nakamurella sp. YIM 132087]|uniref:EamA family transporter n=1 Tax=Nakamurella alba TaxID=2665158 RepID=A0A7K1FL30_9ACTN|nr:DMT family transporter [Nakamurella alba]MTD14857.1 EamA family transporter [Nakamurella alba]